MNVRELIERLQAMNNPEAHVSFDTDAAHFHVHLVAVDDCEDQTELIGRPLVVLLSNEERDLNCPGDKRSLGREAGSVDEALLLASEEGVEDPEVHCEVHGIRLPYSQLSWIARLALYDGLDVGPDGTCLLLG